jgi:hypothetical protein
MTRPESTHRYKEFLENYHFFSNNVEFRIVSSSALEKWKNVQAFQLNQVTRGNFYFPKDRRETLLLKYDLWSRWLFEIENLMIELGGNNRTSEIQPHDKDIIISLAKKTSSRYFEILSNEKDTFKGDFSEIWLRTHTNAFNHMLDEIREIEGSYISAFVNIVNLLVEVMQYTLTEIHELNQILIHSKEVNVGDELKDVFLVVSDFCLKYFMKTGKCLVSQRVKIYKEYFNIQDVYIKNYTEKALPRVLFEHIENAGVKIDLKRSLFQ